MRPQLFVSVGGCTINGSSQWTKCADLLDSQALGNNSGKTYNWPWAHFTKHPHLVVCVAVNYKLRQLKILPDKWYAKDLQLMNKILNGI